MTRLAVSWESQSFALRGAWSGNATVAEWLQMQQAHMLGQWLRLRREA